MNIFIKKNVYISILHLLPIFIGMEKIYKTAIIYSIKCPNNKIYIGRWTKDFNSLKNRYFIKEFIKGKRPINNAIRKYGINNVEIEVLETCYNITNDDINQKEKFYIKLNNSLTTENGYNVSEGGDCHDTITNHPDRERIINNIKKRLKFNHPRKGIKLTSEIKNKIGLKAKERLKDKTKHPMFGKKQTNESIQKNSLSQKGKRTGEFSSTWKDFIVRERLIVAIEKNMSYIQMYDFFNCGQKLIVKSLIFHFKTKSIPTIKLMLKINDKDFNTEIKNLGYRKFSIKYKTNQRIIKNLHNIYNT